MYERHGVTPEVANEALTDVDAQVFDPDPKSTSGQSVRVIGFAASSGEVYTVIVVAKSDGDGWWGVNGWPSNGTDRRIYRDRSTDHE